MAYTTIDKPSDYFNTVLYTGNGSTNAITGVGFQPDWVSIKRRSGSASNGGVFDVVRGVTKLLSTSLTDAEDTRADSLTAFGADGFTLGADTGNYVNTNSETFVSWNWLAGGTASSNTDGSITSSVSANTTSGFSVLTYTGTGSAATVGHGLSAVPKVFWTKRTDSAESWGVYHHTQGAGKFFRLESTNAVDTSSTLWNNTTPTSSVFSIGTGGIANTSGGTYVAYCFAEIQGYSKFGSYTGNGNADGPFVYTGFKPAFVIIKPSSYSNSWLILDNKRPGHNVTNQRLEADSSGAEFSGLDYADFLSNGFKIRTSNAHPNTSGGTLIYMAFAETPIVTSGGSVAPAR